MFKGHWNRFITGLSLALGVLLASASCATTGVGAASPRQPDAVFTWPLVKAESFSWHFGAGDPQDVRVHLVSPAGVAVYLMECHPPDFQQDDFDYSGIYQCRLESVLAFSPGQDLFTKGPLSERDRDSIGFFARSDVRSGSASRVARLRGMRIAFGLRNVNADASGLRSFDFWLRVQPDAGALAAVCCSAEAAGFRTDVGWPGVRPARGRMEVSEASARSASVTPAGTWQQGAPAPGTLDLPVLGISGAHLYDVRCAAFSDFAQRDSRGRPRLGVGCGLYTRDGTNLLQSAADPVSLLNPEYIFPEQLTKGCRDYPGWGAVRMFRLRGMDIRLDATRVVLRDDVLNLPGTHLVFPPLLVRAELEVEVRPDPVAEAPASLPPATVFWGVNRSDDPCVQVLRRPGTRRKTGRSGARGALPAR